MVDVALRLKAAGEEGIRFVLVGDGMSRETLLARIEREGVGDYFSWEGPHPMQDIPRYHTMADALVACLAKSEDIGLTIPAKITSYCAAGRPVLASMDGEGARVIEEAGCGFASPAGAIDALTKNLLSLAHMSDTERNEMGLRGRAYNNANFNRGQLLRQLAGFLLGQDDKPL